MRTLCGRNVVTGIAMMLLTLVLPLQADALRIYTSGTADGTINHYYWCTSGWGEGGWRGAESSGSTLRTYDNTWWSADGETRYDETTRSVIEMPIVSLRGRTLDAHSAKLWLYSFPTFTTWPPRLYVRDSPGTGVVTELSDGGSRSFISEVPAIEGWLAIEVTSHLQEKVNAGFDWISFVLSDASGRRFAASEDPEGRGAYLEIVPEPSGMLALLAGVTGLSGALIRRRS